MLEKLPELEDIIGEVERRSLEEDGDEINLGALLGITYGLIFTKINQLVDAVNALPSQ